MVRVSGRPPLVWARRIRIVMRYSHARCDRFYRPPLCLDELCRWYSRCKLKVFTVPASSVYTFFYSYFAEYKFGKTFFDAARYHFFQHRWRRNNLWHNLNQPIYSISSLIIYKFISSFISYNSTSSVHMSLF